MDTEHREFLNLIPWYVNGTLPEHERAPVERHLQACLPCRAALKHERELREAMRAHGDPTPSAEQALAGLHRRIDGGGAASRPLAAPLWGYGVAAAFGGALVWLVLAASGGPGGTWGDAAFETLAAPAAGRGHRIDILFADTPSDAELARFAAAPGGDVVGGPSELGRYTVALPGSSGADIDRLLNDLGDDPRVRFAGRSFIDGAAAIDEAAAETAP